MVRGAILVLAFCVFLLALGVPTTLLNAIAPADLLAASILEGLSLPPTPHDSWQPTMVVCAVECTFALEPAIFESALFHPPIS